MHQKNAAGEIYKFLQKNGKFLTSDQGNVSPQQFKRQKISIKSKTAGAGAGASASAGRWRCCTVVDWHDNLTADVEINNAPRHQPPSKSVLTDISHIVMSDVHTFTKFDVVIICSLVISYLTILRFLMTTC